MNPAAAAAASGASFRAALWTIGLRAGVRALQFATNLILARLLVPDAFGLMATASAFLQMLQLLSDLGLQTALVQMGGGSKRGLIDAAWALSILRGLILLAGALACAPLLTAFYGISELQPLLQFLAWALLIQAFENPAYASVIQSLDTRRQFIFEFSVAALSACVTVALVFVHPGVWSLATGSLFMYAFRTLGSFVVARPWPRFRFERENLRAVLRPGFALFLNTLCAYLAMNLDVFAAGRLLSLEETGNYHVGRNLALTAELILIQIVGRSFFPAVAQLRNNPEAVRSLYLRTAMPLAAAGALVECALAILAADVLRLLYPPAYAGAAVAAAFIALRGVLRIVGILQGGLALGMGRTRFETLAMLASLLALLCLLPFFETVRDRFSQSGWEHAGIAALACLAFLAWIPGGVTLAILVARDCEFGAAAAFAPYGAGLLVCAWQFLALPVLGVIDSTVWRFLLLAGWSLPPAMLIYFSRNSGVLHAVAKPDACRGETA